MATDSSSLGYRLNSHWERMQAARATWLPQWQEIADLMAPHKAGISVKTYTPNTTRESLLFDTTAGDALMTMAGGLMSWTMPVGDPWFAYDPADSIARSDRVKAWAQDTTTTARKLLAASTFYTQAHEYLLNLCAFGTAAMFFGVEEVRTRFEVLATGSYCIEENKFGEVDTLYREFEYTIEEAAKEFGEENLPKELREMLKDDKQRKQKRKFLHAVYPRADDERPDGLGRLAAHGKKFASCYVELVTKEVVKESGFDVFPYAVSRYLKWAALEGRIAYGYGPGFAAIPDTRQINFIQMMLDCAAEKAIRPPLITDAAMEGDIVQTPGGITYVNASLGQDRWPKPLETVSPGNYQTFQERAKMRQDSINSKFHAQLFNMFANLDGIRTATEINERAAEKIVTITPAFTRLSSEWHTPMLQSLFSLWMESGLLPPPPEEAVIPVSQFSGMIPMPGRQLASRLALAINALSNIGTQRYIQEMAPISAIHPEVFASIDFVKLGTGVARSSGMSSEYIKDADQVQQELAAQAKAAQQQQQLMMAEQASKAVGNAGGIPAIKEAMGQ